MQSQLNSLNAEQRKAVETTEGRVLILAGAGTGKTLVLTTRIAYLLSEGKATPSEVLGLTFTNKAAQEMRQRISKMISKESVKELTLTTFHSFCMKILRKEITNLGWTPHFTLYQQGDVERLLQTLARDILNIDGELPSLSSAIHLINQAKNAGLHPEEIDAGATSWHSDFVRTLYSRFLDAMRAHNALDFDLMLLLTVKLFDEHPEVLDRYQQQFRFILIDEYQDTNPIQFKLADLLSKNHKNLCVVGDDDQSIYGWRGADVKNILEFGDASVVKLEQNYRSTPTILNAANAVIGLNTTRHHKALWSDKEAGEKLTVFNAPSDIDEASSVIYRILKLKELYNFNWCDFAILYRSNSLSRQFEQALIKASYMLHGEWKKGIPYEIFGGVDFFERREIKDLFAYLRVIANPSDQAATLRIINTPRRGVGEKTLDALTQINRTEGTPLWDVLQKEENSKGILEFVAIIKAAQEKFVAGNLGEALTWLIERINYKRAIKEEVKSPKMRQFKWENVEELVSSMAEYSASKPEAALSDYIVDMPLGDDEGQNMKKKKSPNSVQLMTFHSAKGLEFPVCFLVGLEDHIIPHERSMQDTGIEEERRLMYVALTRAKERLYLCMAQKRTRMGKLCPSNPSRFLYEIPKEFTEVVRWDKI